MNNSENLYCILFKRFTTFRKKAKTQLRTAKIFANCKLRTTNLKPEIQFLLLLIVLKVSSINVFSVITRVQ